MSTSSVLGIDACRTGWVGVIVGLEPSTSAPSTCPPAEPVRPESSAQANRLETAGVQVAFGTTIGELVASLGDLTLVAIGIDMPVHPSDDEVRPCDIEVRRHLGGRKQSSVFITPVWPALRASTHEEAVERSRAATGKGVSKQAWALRPKILEVDAWAPAAPCPIYEVHPEVSFSLMTGSPILDKKSTPAGLTARQAALQAQGITIPTDIGITPAAGPDRKRPDRVRRQAKPDDILDAAACAWSASRIATGTTVSFPDPPVTLLHGQLQAIWA